MKAALIVAVLVALSGATGAHAKRVVDYALDDAALAKQSAELKIALPKPLGKGPWHIGLEIAPAVDHDVLTAGIFCSAYSLQNPLSKLLGATIAQWDRNGATVPLSDDSADIRLKIERARTFNRCVSRGETGSTCISRVSIDGLMGRGAAAPHQPFHVEIEKPAEVGGFCAGIAAGIGLVSRLAAADLIQKVDAMASKPAAVPAS